MCFTRNILKDAKFMTPLPADTLTKSRRDHEGVAGENRLVQQRTVRGETTKDKAGALPPAAYAKANPNAVIMVYFSADQVNPTHIASLESCSVADKARVGNKFRK